ncbi:MAG TPA: glycosyltransferase family 39 protein [Candidatus Acidoferrales bacterium]|nr:glycosyltransferase family 39 protein [Candidatus Acidoferrales bacterium]
MAIDRALTPTNVLRGRYSEPPASLSFAPRRRSVIALAAITLLGTVLRLAPLRNGLWRDDAVSYFDILPHSVREVLARVAYSELNPPLFFLVEHLWAARFGYGEIALKMPSFLCSVAAIPALYFVARGALSRGGALGAAALLALSPGVAFYAGEVRPYAMASLFLLLSLGSFLRWLTTGGRRCLCAAALCAALGIWTQYTLLLFLAALALATLLMRDRFRFAASDALAALGAVVLSFVPWFGVFALHARTGEPWYTPMIWFDRVRTIFDTLGETAPFAGWPALMHTEIFSALCSAVILSAAIILFLRVRRTPDPHDLPLTFLSLVFVFSLCAVAAIGYPGGRYFAPFAPIGCVIYAALLQRAYVAMTHRWRSSTSALRWATGIVAVTLAVGNIAAEAQANAEAKSGIRELVHRNAALFTERSIILASPDFGAPTLAYYLRGTSVPVYGFARWEHPEDFRVPDYTAVWSDPGVIDRTMRRLALMRRQGYKRLVLVRPLGLAYGSGTVPFEKEIELGRRLALHYRSLGTTGFFGRVERATLTVVDLRTDRCPQCH